MGFAQLMPSSHPVDGSLFSGVWGSAETQLFINKEGKRFVNEYAERDVLSKAALEQTDGLFFIICDNDIVSTFDPARIKQLEETGCIYVADTLDELAEKMGVPADVFAETIKNYNEYTLNKKDPDFGKEFFGQPIDEAPFTATPRSPSLHHTMGGLRIDPETHVLRADGSVIDGLFAAGEVCGGIHAGNRLGGNAMTDFLVFGRIAGANAASHTETPDTYTSASATKTLLTGDALAAAEAVLVEKSSLLSTADEAKAEGYIPKETAGHAQIMSINPDGSVGLSTISEWKYEDGKVMVKLTKGQNALNLSKIGNTGTLLVSADKATYLLHLRTTDVTILEYTEETAGSFDQFYSGAEQALPEYDITFDVPAIEQTFALMF
jgi:hypothetical protein